MTGNVAFPTEPASGNPVCDREGIPAWIVQAARELTMNADMIPLIARTINQHRPAESDLLVSIERVVAALEEYSPQSVKMSLEDYLVTKCANT